jgi:hypothetical protein
MASLDFIPSRPNCQLSYSWSFPNRNDTTVPEISVADFLQRLTTHAALTPSLLLTIIYYMDRLCSLYPAFSVTSLTIHRFLVAAATVTAKGLSDSYCSNGMYARVGGVRVTELSILELELLCGVDWKIVPCPEVLVDYYCSLVARDNTTLMYPIRSAKQSRLCQAPSQPSRVP